MRYPCAHEGVRKIRIAAILTIAVTVMYIIADLLAVLAADSLDHWQQLGEEIPPAAIVIAILAVPMGILEIAGIVIRIIGVKRASQEEPEFDNAFWMIFIQLVLSVINSFIAEDCREAKLYLAVGIDILGLASTIIIIKGIRTLAGFLDNSEVESEAPAVRNFFVIAYVIGIGSGIASFILTNHHNNFYFVSGVQGLIEYIILMAAYFYYLRFLRKAEAMLGYDLYMTSDAGK